MTGKFETLTKEDEFDAFIQKNHDKLALIKFSTSQCPPCKELQKNIEELLTELKKSTEREKNLVVMEVDAEKFPQLAQRSQFQVYSVPTIFLFYQGQLIKKGSGSMNIQQLRKFIGI